MILEEDLALVAGLDGSTGDSSALTCTRFFPSASSRFFELGNLPQVTRIFLKVWEVPTGDVKRAWIQNPIDIFFVNSFRGVCL